MYVPKVAQLNCVVRERYKVRESIYLYDRGSEVFKLGFETHIKCDIG